MSLSTTEPAPTTHPSPIVTPFNIEQPEAIQDPFLIVIGRALWPWWIIGTSNCSKRWSKSTILLWGAINTSSSMVIWALLAITVYSPT